MQYLGTQEAIAGHPADWTAPIVVSSDCPDPPKWLGIASKSRLFEIACDRGAPKRQIANLPRMRSRNLLYRSVEFGVGLLPSDVQRIIEAATRMQQGKGWGASSTDAEARACVELLGKVPGSPLAVDVGANAGNWTASLLRELPNALVHVLEPSGAACRRLAMRFASSPNIHIAPIALSSQSGEATLWSPEPGSVLGSLTKRRLDHYGIADLRPETVQVQTLTEFCRAIGAVPDILKLDVEGHEFEILDSSRDLLDKINVIQFEFGVCNIDTRTYFQDFWYLLAPRGFALYRLTPRGLAKIARYREIDEAFEVINFFAVRPN